MGLFTNNKKLCPICGSPTPRLLAAAVEGQNLCRECAGKIDLPDGVRDNMTVDDFREYIACHDANKPLRDSFTDTYHYGFGFFKGSLHLDLDHQLFRMGDGDAVFAMEPSNLKSFRILEDDKVLFEGEKGNFRSYKTDIKERLKELKPQIEQYKMLLHEYRIMEEMEGNHGTNNDDRPLSDRISEPQFNIPNPVDKFYVELKIEHPYWKEYNKETGAPSFDTEQPSTIDYLEAYNQKVEELHVLAQNLMQILDPQVQETVVDNTSAQAAPQAQAASAQTEDPTVALPKYKALLDAGVITEEEFAAKKKQLLGL